MNISIYTGESSNIRTAINNLEKQLNALLADYEFIGSMIITIDRSESSSHCSVMCYASQMVRRKM